MNDIYFACRTCKNYVDAGYRHAAWTLRHEGIVQDGQPVDLQAVWNAEEYWHGGDDCDWLAELLPQVRTFLNAHSTHDLIFAEAETFMPYDDDGDFLLWMNEAGYVLELTPRYFVERLHFSHWKQVEEYISREASPPMWWLLPDLRHKAKVIFTYAVRGMTL